MMNTALRFLAGQFRRAPQVLDVNQVFEERLTFGERLADRVAAVGGSWTFIISFSAFLLVWGVLNTIALSQRAFDPFPFIFLNLMLSMLAALQAPVIMMSQNRQAAKDRLEVRLDYETNLRTEAEIASLHEKVDLLLAMAGDEERRDQGDKGGLAAALSGVIVARPVNGRFRDGRSPGQAADFGSEAAVRTYGFKA